MRSAAAEVTMHPTHPWRHLGWPETGWLVRGKSARRPPALPRITSHGVWIVPASESARSDSFAYALLVLPLLVAVAQLTRMQRQRGAHAHLHRVISSTAARANRAEETLTRAQYRRTTPRRAYEDRCTSSGPYDERGRTCAPRTTTTALPAAPTTGGSSSVATGTPRWSVGPTAVRCAAHAHRAAETLDESAAYRRTGPRGASHESLGAYDERYGTSLCTTTTAPPATELERGYRHDGEGTRALPRALGSRAYLYSASCNADHKREEEEGDYAKPI
ncbi:hypothetical protein B0H13DRAFT_2669049 [Mycena leptocephala]|nr:hypothetical protein B0H13DRAFT_2669049 [Mycena leptocephala]